MTDDEGPLPDPDDDDALAEMSQQIREYLAATSLDVDTARELVAALLGMNRRTQETLLSLAMIVRRVPTFTGAVLADQLEAVAGAVGMLTIPPDEDTLQ